MVKETAAPRRTVIHTAVALGQLLWRETLLLAGVGPILISAEALEVAHEDLLLLDRIVRSLLLGDCPSFAAGCGVG